MSTNRRILLVQRPVGMVTDDCYKIVEEPVPEPGDGEVIVHVEYLSLDPAMRGWMDDASSYMAPMALDEPVRSAGAGTVIASRLASYAVGMKVIGLFGWQDYARIGGSTGVIALPLDDDAIFIDALSVFGTTGLTAYFGITDIGRLVAGETFVVSGAAGGVGSIAGQIAKIIGCRVIGVAGTDDKCTFVVDELGFDACVNYRTASLVDALRAECPNGIDVYFDNVGGDVLDAALQCMNMFGRIVACGMISQYNDVEPPPGPRYIGQIVTQRLRMEGLILLDYLARFDEGIAKLSQWVREGRLHSPVHLVDGLLEAPRALNMLFTGENLGKLVVKV